MKKIIPGLLSILLLTACGDKSADPSANVVSGKGGEVAVIDGGKLYKNNCAMCHGPNGLGIDGPLSAIKAANLQQKTHELADNRRVLVGSILNGKNAMPPMRGRITEAQADAILDYVAQRSVPTISKP